MTIELRSARFLLAFVSACGAVACGDDGGTLGWGGQPGLAGASSAGGKKTSGGGNHQGLGGASGGGFSFTGGVNGSGTGGALVGAGGIAGPSSSGGTQSQTGGAPSMSGGSGQSATGGTLTNQGGSAIGGSTSKGGSNGKGGSTSGGSNGKGGSASGGSNGKGGSASGGSNGKGGSTSGGTSTMGGSSSGGSMTGGSASAGSGGVSSKGGAGGMAGAGSGTDLCPYAPVGTHDPWCFLDVTDFGHWSYIDTSTGFAPTAQWVQAGSDGYAHLIVPFTATNQETQFAVGLSTTEPLDLSGRVLKARVRRTAGSGPGTIQLFATSLGWNRATAAVNNLTDIPSSSWTELSFVLDPAAVSGGFDPNAIIRLGLYLQSGTVAGGLTTNELEVDSVWIE